MLGHKLWQNLAKRFEVHATLRKSPSDFPNGLFDPAQVHSGVSAEDFDSVRVVVEELRPEVLVNCIGVVKQDAAGKDPVTSIAVNSLFPHRLAKLSQESNARLVHVSTDCVFSGRAGNYAETDVPDAEDLYGRTKLLGEVTGEGCLTIRTSMIGRELTGSHGLLEWFLSQRGGRVRGFKRAIFSGFTTRALAEVIAKIIADHPELDGIYHVAAEPISKFDLLTLVQQTYGLAVEIEPDETFVCDRSLDGSRFRAATNFVPPSWSDMVTGLANDPTPYDEIRRSL
jgi:dTDP-4-dehydrorhamnose reductase